MTFRPVFLGILMLLVAPLVCAGENYACVPTPQDEQGPFYKANAPQRSWVGSGYRLEGIVRSAADCAPLAGARLEIWLNGPDGRYDDRYRATLHSDRYGRFLFESHVPVPYGSRPPHLHLIINAARHRELVTQFYPKSHRTEESFTIILEPDEGRK